MDNPKGDDEWESIKQIGKNPELLDGEGRDGRANKCISMLLQKVPLKHNDKVIFMTRPLEEVVVSQNAMVSRLGTWAQKNSTPNNCSAGCADPAAKFSIGLNRCRTWSLLRSIYPTLVRYPRPVIDRVVKFLGVDWLPNSAEMAKVIDPSLQHKKSS